MKTLTKTIATLALGLLFLATPVQADQRTVTHFGNEFTLEEWLTVGPGRNNSETRAVANFEAAWERQQRNGNNGGSSNNATTTNTTPATVTPAPEQPVTVTPSVPVQPVAPSTPVVNDSVPADVMVSNLSNRPEEFANHQMLEVELEVLRLVNEIRAEHGLQPLILDLALSVAARSHSEDMSVNQFLSHTGSNGSTPTERTLANGVPFSSAENAATANGFSLRHTATWNAEQVVQRWMDSQGHRANILSRNSTHLGVGFYQNRWTQKFVNVNGIRHNI